LPTRAYDDTKSDKETTIGLTQPKVGWIANVISDCSVNVGVPVEGQLLCDSIRIPDISAWYANDMLSDIRAKPPPLVPHIEILPAKLDHNIAILTAISSSHCKNLTDLCCSATSMSELAGVIGYHEKNSNQ